MFDLHAGRRISAAHPACKSELMMLCDRFIRKFGRLGAGGEPAEIMLNNVAAQLGVPRRRLYDIINVMEAVEVTASSGTKLGRLHAPECHIVPPRCSMPHWIRSGCSS